MCGGGGLKLWRVLSVVVITIDNTVLLDTTMPESYTLGVLCDILFSRRVSRVQRC